MSVSPIRYDTVLNIMMYVCRVVLSFGQQWRMLITSWLLLQNNEFPIIRSQLTGSFE